MTPPILIGSTVDIRTDGRWHGPYQLVQVSSDYFCYGVWLGWRTLYLPEVLVRVHGK